MSIVRAYTNTLGGPAEVQTENGVIRRIRPLKLADDDAKGWTIEARGMKFSPPRLTAGLAKCF